MFHPFFVFTHPPPYVTNKLKIYCFSPHFVKGINPPPFYSSKIIHIYTYNLILNMYFIHYKPLKSPFYLNLFQTLTPRPGVRAFPPTSNNKTFFPERAATHTKHSPRTEKKGTYRKIQIALFSDATWTNTPPYVFNYYY